MEEQRLVSIVLPVYNGAKNVANSIESILQQTYQNWELIAVNDCSTDDTLAVLEKYEKLDSRIHLLSNAVNLKLPQTLNVGFAAAKGDYYTWTSDDNRYKPEAIARMVEELQADPSLSMVYANYITTDSEGNLLEIVRFPEPEQLSLCNCIGACFLYTALTAKSVGTYDANLFLAEDYDYWIRIYRHGKIKHINEELYYYMHHSTSLSETQKDAVLMQTYKTLEKHFLFLYMNAKQHGTQFALLDFMLYCCTPEQAKTVFPMLCVAEPCYPKELKRRAIKEKIKGTALGRVLLKIKRHFNGQRKS